MHAGIQHVAHGSYSHCVLLIQRRSCFKQSTWKSRLAVRQRYRVRNARALHCLQLFSVYTTGDVFYIAFQSLPFVYATDSTDSPDAKGLSSPTCRGRHAEVGVMKSGL